MSNDERMHPPVTHIKLGNGEKINYEKTIAEAEIQKASNLPDLLKIVQDYNREKNPAIIFVTSPTGSPLDTEYWTVRGSAGRLSATHADEPLNFIHVTRQPPGDQEQLRLKILKTRSHNAFRIVDMPFQLWEPERLRYEDLRVDMTEVRIEDFEKKRRERVSKAHLKKNGAARLQAFSKENPLKTELLKKSPFLTREQKNVIYEKSTPRR